MYQEQRNLERFPLNLEARVSGIDAEGNTFNEETVTVNISSGGVYLHLDNKVNAKSHMKLVISFVEGGNVKVLRDGWVVRVEELEEMEKVGAAVRFMRNASGEKQSFTSWIM